MKLQVLHIPGCPHTHLLITRLATLVDDRIPIEEKEIQDQDEAAAWGMHGSPTLLIDGMDPFAVDDVPPALACRLYRDEHGALAGSPTVGQLRAVLALKGMDDD